MAQIESIQVHIETGDESGAGTDGSIYVGVGGREFHLDTSADDFERGSSHDYVLGEGSDVVNPAVNDPRKQFVQTEEVESFPIYVRFEPNNSGDNWNLGASGDELQRSVLPRVGDDDLRFGVRRYLARPAVWQRRPLAQAPGRAAGLTPPREPGRAGKRHALPRGPAAP
jgi:hypothetical protein